MVTGRCLLLLLIAAPNRLSSAEKLSVPLFQVLLTWPFVLLLWKVNGSAIETFEAVLEGRAVVFGHQRSGHVYDVVWTDADEVRVIRAVMELAQSQPSEKDAILSRSHGGVGGPEWSIAPGLDAVEIDQRRPKLDRPEKDAVIVVLRPQALKGVDEGIIPSMSSYFGTPRRGTVVFTESAASCIPGLYGADRGAGGLKRPRKAERAGGRLLGRPSKGKIAL
jgi:hypothetical protein